MSGLNQQFTKLSTLNRVREFESHRLRNGSYKTPARAFLRCAVARVLSASVGLRPSLRFPGEEESHLSRSAPPPQNSHKIRVTVTIDRMTREKILKTILFGTVGIFALIGLLFTLVFFGMYVGLFNVRGTIEQRNEFFLGSAIVSTKPCAETCGWAESPEWETVREGLRKDAAVIQRVSAETGVPARLIAAVVVPEQLRFFTSEREIYKQVFEPLKILGSLSQFSLGVSGIKQETAVAIEKRVDPSLAHLVAYKEGVDRNKELYNRLTDSSNHYYSYLYTALFIKEIQDEWRTAGFPIDMRPGIVGTLFNIGFENSRPNANPQIGGASMTIGSETYTFGSLTELFYFSDELGALFLK